MGTYYVRTNGSDTTGDGSSANPWASLNKAITSIPLAGGHTVLFGPGTYTQDGNCNKSYASLVTFKPEIPGAEVHFTNSTTNSVMALTTPCSNYRFENIYFDGSATSGSCIYPAVTGTTISNVEFYRCTFTASGKASQYCVKTYVSGTCSIAITFTECTFFSDKVNSSGMIYAQCASPASQVVSYTFDRCTASNTAACNLTNLEGVTNTVINGGSWNSAGIAIALGKDAATGYATAGCQVRNAVVQSSASHALLLGGGSDGAVVDGCDITISTGPTAPSSATRCCSKAPQRHWCRTIASTSKAPGLPSPTPTAQPCWSRTHRSRITSWWRAPAAACAIGRPPRMAAGISSTPTSWISRAALAWAASWQRPIARRSPTCAPPGQATVTAPTTPTQILPGAAWRTS